MWKGVLKLESLGCHTSQGIKGLMTSIYHRPSVEQSDRALKKNLPMKVWWLWLYSLHI